MGPASPHVERMRVYFDKIRAIMTGEKKPCGVLP